MKDDEWSSVYMNEMVVAVKYWMIDAFRQNRKKIKIKMQTKVIKVIIKIARLSNARNSVP